MRMRAFVDRNGGIAREPRAGRRREHDAERRAARARQRDDGAVVILDDATHDGEPEPGAAGREEGNEHVREVGLGDAATVVGDLDDEAAVIDPGVDTHAAHAGRVTLGVAQEVHQHLLHTRRVEPRVADVGRHGARRPRACRLDRARRGRSRWPRPGAQTPDASRAGAQGLGEVEQLVHHAVHALGLALEQGAGRRSGRGDRGACRRARTAVVPSANSGCRTSCATPATVCP